MKTFMRQLSFSWLVLMVVLGLGGLQTAYAQGNSGNAPGKSAMAPGKNKNLGHGNASDGIKAIIQANRQIFYSGDLLEIGVRFPRGAQLIQSGEVDAWLVIFDPDAAITAVPISSEASANTKNLFRIDEVDVEFLPEGVYQMGVVLTVPDGDPLDLADWYNGLLGLQAVRGITVSESLLEIDEDGDGMVDDDTSGDGFVDDDSDDDTTDDSDDDADDSTDGDTGDDSDDDTGTTTP